LREQSLPGTTAVLYVLEYCYLSDDKDVLFHAETYVRSLEPEAFEQLISLIGSYTAMWSKTALQTFLMGNALIREGDNCGLHTDPLESNLFVQGGGYEEYLKSACNLFSGIVHSAGCKWAGSHTNYLLVDLPQLREPFLYALVISACDTKRDVVWRFLSGDDIWRREKSDSRIRVLISKVYLLLSTLAHSIIKQREDSPLRRVPRLFDVDTSALEKLMSDVCLERNLADEALLLLEYSWNGNAKNLDDARLARIGKQIADPDVLYGSMPVPTIGIAAHAASEIGFTWDQIGYLAAVYDNCSETAPALASSLMNAGVYGLSQLLMTRNSTSNLEAIYSPAWKLQQWSLPETKSAFRSKHGILFSIFKRLHDARSANDWKAIINEGYSMALEFTVRRGGDFSLLAVLQELKEITALLRGDGVAMLEDTIALFKHRSLELLRDNSFEVLDDRLMAREVCWSVGYEFLSSDTRLIGSMPLTTVQQVRKGLIQGM
jgi:hypothetical protein